MAATGLLKSRSVPGLLSLGTAGPKDGFHGRKTTLAYRIDGPVDKQEHMSPPSNKAASMAEMLKKPAWRWTSVEKLPKTPELADVAPKNMKWPRLSPAWLKHDKQVLRFYGFFQEHVVERWDENCRYRNVVICYHMEDGTIQISEPKIENSGIPQGQFLKRHQVAASDGSPHIGPQHFRIGEDITIYGVTYHITGADRFTHWFYEENGVDVGEDEPLQKDQWQKSYTFTKIAEKGGLPASRSAVEAKQLTAYMLGQPPAELKLVQFLQNDRKVLRFKAYWDDPTLYGNRIYFTIHYYLANNTMEINEAHARNSGRDNYPVFHKRGPIYKENNITPYPGMLEPDKIPYEPADLMVGGSIDVWRRKIVIYDCDDFTRKFYKEYLGIDQAENKIDVSEKPLRHQKLCPPPHSAPGTEEDSLMNVLMIQPKAAKQDLARLMTLSGEVLRFEAKMVNGEPEDENRRFIIGFFPADDNLAVWELQVRNSGHMGGKFKEKGHWKNPDTGKYFDLQDLAIGKTVCLAAQPFLIMRADEHTLAYLERHCEDVPFSNPMYCASLLHPLRDWPGMQDEHGIDPDTLRAVAAEHSVHLIDHEIITLLRNFNTNEGENAAPLISGPRILEALHAIQAHAQGQ